MEPFMPRRYRMDGNGEMRRTWNGKLPEEFTVQDTLLFMADTDLSLSGRVSEDTLAAINRSGYHYENGALTPLQPEERRTATMENEKKALDISVKLYPQEDKGKLLAFANVTIGGCFAVNGIRLMDSEKGKFVAMPSNKGSDGKYHDICCPTTKEMREALNAAVLGEYQIAMEKITERPVEKAAEKPSLRGALQSAAKEAAARPAPDAQKAADKGAR